MRAFWDPSGRLTLLGLTRRVDIEARAAPASGPYRRARRLRRVCEPPIFLGRFFLAAGGLGVRSRG